MLLPKLSCYYYSCLILYVNCIHIEIYMKLHYQTLNYTLHIGSFLAYGYQCCCD